MSAKLEHAGSNQKEPKTTKTTKTTGTPIASQFGDWVADLKFGDLPESVVSEAKRSILEAVGNMVFGSQQARMEGYLSALHAPAGTANRRLQGLTDASRAFVTAAYVQSSEMDDIFFGAGGHPGSAIIPAVLALSARKPLSGQDAITGTVAGYEIMARATLPVYPQCHMRGFQATGFGGPFGAAAAAAKIAGLHAAVTSQALAIVGSYCCGLTEYDQGGGEVKRLYAALAARAGIEATDMAAAGVTGPLTIFEGLHGLFSAFADYAEPALATNGLGSPESELYILRRWSKRYPAVGSVHGALDALSRLFLEPRAESEIETILIEVPEMAVEHGGGVGVPDDLVGAQFSFAYSAALRVIFGSNDIRLYEDPAVRGRPDVVNLCRKVTVTEVGDPSALAQSGAIVTVTMTDGITHRRLQYAPVGTAGCPAEPADLAARFDQLTQDALPSSARRDLADAIMHLDELTDLGVVRELIGLYI